MKQIKQPYADNVLFEWMEEVEGKKIRLLFTGIVCRIKYCIMSELKKVFFSVFGKQKFSMEIRKKFSFRFAQICK